MKRYVLLLLLGALPGRVAGYTPADTGRVVVAGIEISGNQRTRNEVILREFTFQAGDTLTLQQLYEQLHGSRLQLLNTGLFHDASFSIRYDAHYVWVQVSVIERWYIIPLPALNLYDRNFNVWWVEHRRDLRWLQYGLRFYYKNFTGNNDELRLTALTGFQQNFSLLYSHPQMDSRRRHGLNVFASYSRSKRVAYGLEENREQIYEDINRYQRTYFSANADYQWRPAHRYRYVATLGYRRYHITDTIAELNPDYAGNGANLLHYLYIKASWIRDFRDVVAYPLHGSYQELTLTRMGLGFAGNFSGWSLQTTTAFYQQWGKWYAAATLRLKLSTPANQPYLLQRSLGYGSDYVAGYEYYAINGTSFGYVKLNWKRPLWEWKLPTRSDNIFTRGTTIPVAVYAKLLAEAGLVNQPAKEAGNQLANLLLAGGGAGLDLVLFYDTSLRLNYAINRLGEHGLFLHYSTYF